MKLIHSAHLRYRYLPIFSLLFLFLVWNLSNAQSNSGYSILVAGHAYGAHAGTNIGLHPPFLQKLHENQDTSVVAIFLTGDIVNNSTTASWNQVETELSGLGFPSYYVMGNHDNNSVGHAVFQQKHGGTYYSATIQNELYIVLNSTESDRSISPAQLQFLDNTLKNALPSQKKVFIFFHEIIWNSLEKYRLVRSNSRSRYEFMINISNFWNQVFPMLTAYPEKNFYLLAGDVGGNPDAIAASYDRWGNVTLISSGMGEVQDENYLKVDILPDTVKFTLIPLNSGVAMKPITWYNIPEKPGPISGLPTVVPPESLIRYEVSPIFNATSYRWKVSSGIFGSSDSSAINLSFKSGFQKGKLSVTAINDGFGESDPAEMEINAENTLLSENETKPGFSIHPYQQFFRLTINSEISQKAQLNIYDQSGRNLFSQVFFLDTGKNLWDITKNLSVQGLLLFELAIGDKRLVQKTIVH